MLMSDAPKYRIREVDVPRRIVAQSAGMRRVFALAERVAKRNTTVLITGETGVGKEVVAGHIHERSPRAQFPFRTVDCPGLPRDLMQSILFGHATGSFTGAKASHIGQFEAADGGTLLLDDIGGLPYDMQSKLLRVLETRRIRRVGSQREQKIDVRVIATTNEPLDSMVAAGRFRADLFYRLNVFAIKIPPLRERADDILPLARLFLAPEHKVFSEGVAMKLAKYGWPGNVRELRNAMDYAVVVSEGERIVPKDLPAYVRGNGATKEPVPESALEAVPEMPPAPTPLGSVEMIERAKSIQRDETVAALRQAKGNKSEAARSLGINRTTLQSRCKAHGIAWEDIVRQVVAA